MAFHRSEARKIIGLLGVTQIVSWGSIYYAFSVLGPEIQKELGWRSEIVYGAYSWSLLVAGLLSTPAGIMLDKIGGRAVMGCGSLAAGIGLMMASSTASVLSFYAAWTLLGGAMALTLYEAAFATINREILDDSRKAISMLTLFGGFASTVFWPLTLQVSRHVGWRETYFLYGIVHLVLCLPLHGLLPSGRSRPLSTPAAPTEMRRYALGEALRQPAFWKLSFAFATNAFIFAGLSVHLIPILHRFGHPLATVVAFAALIGPMQVAGRIAELAFANTIPPQAAGKIAFAALPAALLGLVLLGAQEWMAAIFCILYGLSNGILTIVRGTVPQALFGRKNYGAISGAMTGPALIAKAAAPLAIAALLEANIAQSLLLEMLLGIVMVSLLGYWKAVTPSARRQIPADAS
jgi:MFS family permease